MRFCFVRGTDTMTSTKKTKKPLIEKQRRERMNKSLIQIKQLVLQATNKNEMNYMKMEKADILEMTVTFLKNLQKPQTCINHQIPSDAIKQNFHTFQEATSTTLLSEDSPGRDARKIQDKKRQLDSPGLNSPVHSPISQCSEHTFPCSAARGGVHGQISSKKISETRIDGRTDGRIEGRMERNSEENVSMKKEICWRPW